MAGRPAAPQSSTSPAGLRQWAQDSGPHSPTPPGLGEHLRIGGKGSLPSSTPPPRVLPQHSSPILLEACVDSFWNILVPDICLAGFVTSFRSTRKSPCWSKQAPHCSPQPEHQAGPWPMSPGPQHQGQRLATVEAAGPLRGCPLQRGEGQWLSCWWALLIFSPSVLWSAYTPKIGLWSLFLKVTSRTVR